MLTVKNLGDGRYHLYSGNPQDRMLYRYGILEKDEAFGPCTDPGSCRADETTVWLSAEREVTITLTVKKLGYSLSIPMGEAERLFGMGDATRKSAKLRGQTVEIDIKNVTGYGPMPIFLSTDGWAFLLNSTYRSVFDFGVTQQDTITIDVSQGEPDFYLFSGESLAALIGKVTDVTGKPMLLPKFSYGLTFVQNEFDNARSLLWDIRTLRDRDIPCDVMGLEPSWMGKYYDFSVDKTWNKEKFPLTFWKPDNYSGTFSFFYPMRKMGMQLGLWLCQDYDLLYAEENEVNAQEVRDSTDGAVIDDPHLMGAVWSDQLTKKDEPWFEHLKKFVDNGAAAFKLDGSNQVLHHPDRLWGGKYRDAEVHNVYPVIYAKQMQNGYRDYTDRRLQVYTSGAYIGTQRYAATWAGDTGGGYDTVVSLLNYAMCGHSNTTCDIDVTPEGLHYGFLMPWAQYFTWANWEYPWFMGDELENLVRYYAKLRSSLVPYLYTMAYKAYAEAMPMLRPLPLMYPDDVRFDDVINAYMLGDSLYVGVFDMHLLLPPGEWIDYFTGKTYAGDVDYTVPEGRGGALLVRKGSVLVTMQPQKYILEKQHDYIIQVFPGADAEFTLYEDDGFTFDYEKGIGTKTRIAMKCGGNGFDLTIFPREGSFAGRPDNGHDVRENSIPKILGTQPEKNMTVEIHGAAPAKILCGDEEIAFVYDGRKAVFTAKTAERNNQALCYSVLYG